KLLIMDEPTSVLTPQEVALLFRTLRQLAAGGCSILYISHKLHEIKELCDRATILRGGRVVGACVPAEESSKSLAELMIGGSLKSIAKVEGRKFGAPKFTVRGLNMPKIGDFGTALADIAFSVRAGEILGIAGVAGNGQNELLLALSGEIPASDANAILIGNAAIGGGAIGARRRAGLSAVPEERNGHGAVPEFSLTDNAILTARDRMKLARGGLVDAGRARGYAAEIIQGFSVKATGPEALAESLSGGNLQKYIMGREILQTPEVLIVSQPTWGVDAGAAAAIHQALVDLAARGSAIVVISQDLDELLALSDGLAVINQGRLSRVMRVGEVAIDEIGLLMGGVHGDPKATAELAHDPHLTDIYATPATGAAHAH
ncbi:MAG: ATP-binding cassette domain-containing protein, partial [Rhodobacteraceae bacterium]|nr:ATP-binding cassette domain-containing protein [Paracoccaceae bacterium]